MNDLKNLLEKALDEAPTADAPIDPSPDLLRGRTRLRRRRTVTLAGATAVALGLVIVPLTVNGTGSPTRTGPASASDTGKSGASSSLPTLELVAYHGKQIPGYRVASTPKGWVIQGGDAFVLTIAPKGAKDDKYESFASKLVVMLQSKDAAPPTTGTVQAVDGRPGRLDVQGDTQMLTYRNTDQRWMVIQAPTSLGWTGDRLAEFAAGVEVLDNAQAGVG
jgi:hypothetical protein